MVTEIVLQLYQEIILFLVVGRYISVTSKNLMMMMRYRNCIEIVAYWGP